MNTQLIATVLSYETLNCLRHSNVPAIWLKAFYPPLLCKHAVEKILSSKEISYYPEAPNFKRIGQPYSLAYEGNAEGDSSVVGSYFANSIKTVTHMRDKIFHPYYSPLDDLRLKLDEIWPGGASLKTVKQQKYLAGVIRIMQTMEVDIAPHTDRYLPLYPEFDKTYANQLTANIYLETPAQHGELKLWLKSPGCPVPIEQTSKLAVFNKETLGPPEIIIQPEQGDLVLFNPCLLHSVGGGMEGSRISLGLFIGLNDESEPIEYWS